MPGLTGHSMMTSDSRPIKMDCRVQPGNDLKNKNDYSAATLRAARTPSAIEETSALTALTVCAVALPA
jgi:hypothetical protein